MAGHRPSWKMFCGKLGTWYSGLTAKVREVPPSCLKLKYTGWENAMATFSCTGRRLDGCTEPCMLLFFGPVPGEEPTPSCPALQAEEPGKGGGFNTVSWAWLCLPAANHCLSPLQLETLNKETVALGGASPGLCSFGTTDIGAGCLPTAGVLRTAGFGAALLIYTN